MTKTDVVNLNSVFNRIFAYILTLKRNISTVQPSLAEVRKNILDGLEQTAWVIREKGIDPRDYDDARFALCVWIDETLLNMPWIHRNEWQRTMLQTELYACARGGDEFFERLNRLTPAQNAVREVYYVCLALGFVGRYCQGSDAGLLEQLKRSTLNMLVGDTAGLAAYGKRVVFRNAFTVSTTASNGDNDSVTGRSNLMASWVMFLPPVVLIILMMVYTFVLNNMSDNLITRVIGG